MAQKSLIEWTDATWNPIRGCSRCSPGCERCYAERRAARFCKPGLPFNGLAVMTPAGPRWTNQVQLIENAVELPLHWRTPRMIFANSMSDVFHEKLPPESIARVFAVMTRAHWHTFQVLTKRANRLRELAPHLPWPANLWMGVSVENADYQHRIDDLRRVPAAVRFLSLEPLLGPLPQLNLDGIHWVIVGGESGPGARPMAPDWVRSIRDQCLRSGVPFFFKQWGGVQKKKAGRTLDDQTWDQMPVPIPYREVGHANEC